MTPIEKLKNTFFEIIDTQPATASFLLAYSGGLDSTVLLHLMHCYCECNDRQLHAIHVNHQLQKDCYSWEQHCQKQCQDLGISFSSFTISASIPNGESIEAWAREQRYEVLAEQMQKDMILLTAHHQDDQAETVLLQLFRGAGPQGLSAMPATKAFANGNLLRPLLAFSRVELEDYAYTHHLKWIEDPSNQCTDYNRNFLRQEIVPQLKTHWPALARTLSRSASNIAAMNQALSYYIEQELKNIQLNDPTILNIKLLSELSEQIQPLVIRQWLKGNDFDIPSNEHINRIQCDVIASASDAKAEVCFGNTVVRKFRKGLFVTRQLKPVVQEKTSWDLIEPFETAIGVLSVIQNQDKGIKKSLIPDNGVEIRYREGGERIQISGHDHHSELKKLMLDAGILPWYRGLLPLVYINERLVCIPGFWLSAEFAANENEDAIVIKWQDDMSFLTPDV